MELSSVQLLANRLLKDHELYKKGWRFRFDRAKRRAGSCRFSDKEITLAKAYAEQGDLKDIKNTILHEIAHALVGPKDAHNAIWKQKALEIGCDAERCHDVIFSKPKYLLTCGNNCFEVARYRVNQNFLQSKICIKCRGKLLIIEI